MDVPYVGRYKEPSPGFTEAASRRRYRRRRGDFGMDSPIVVSKPDLQRLRSLLRPLAADESPELLELEAELDRATIVDVESLPPDVVAMDSIVTLIDVESGQRDVYQLVVPSRADISRGRISVLAPLGTALLGYRVGDEVTWRMPRGVRRVRIEAVEQPASVS